MELTVFSNVEIISGLIREWVADISPPPDTLTWADADLPTSRPLSVMKFVPCRDILAF